ncbi:MAG TPA: hypothetical protein VM370_05700 [Candidatus Thermoplasmatota archaeon]|nr:hypothetical protein [Candidatus Thermoplasmatota archaeon]
MRTLGILTADFSVYYDLVQALRARGVAFETLTPGEPVPEHIGVVITTDAEASYVVHPTVVAFRGLDTTIHAALRLLQAPGPFRTCVIGIDPGERPGVAVLADGRVLQLTHARAPEHVQTIVRDVRASVPSERFVVRIGDGAPTFRDRILQTLGDIDAAFELVDERRSTPQDYHTAAERDTGAATNIALTPGAPLMLSDIHPARPTEGELRDIQRKSRMASQGTLTISRALARNVALGYLSLDAAIDRMKQKA